MYKPVKGFEGLYEISEFGEIRSVDRMVGGKSGSTWKRKGKKLKPQTNQNGYAMVNLRKNGARKTMTVHRLVATAFLPNPENLPEVHHKNHDPRDNRLENLQWVTSAEQKDEHWKSAMSKVKSVRLHVIGHGIDKVYNSGLEVERELGISSSCISQVANGIYKQVKGYRIYFAD